MRARDSFVGRARELAVIDAAYAGGAQLVTLVGPPGAGKTRLATEIAHRTAGSVVCALVDVTTREALVAACAAALGAHAPPSAGADDALATVGRALARRDGLVVVLDNLEQVAEVAASVVSEWLDAAPGVRFLATSREALRIRGEHRVEISSLGEEDALALYAARSNIVGARVAIDDADARALVRRLDGLPLAIEMAASRAHVVPAARMVAALDRQLDVLTNARRDGPAMHASLRHAIGTSWELLAPEERVALAECTVFRGGLSLEAARAIVTASDPGRAEEIVLALVDRSMMRVEREAGMRLALYDAVRAYAGERLASMGTGADVARRHAAHYVAEAEQRVRGPHGGGGTAMLRWLGSERENLLEAHRATLAEHPALAARAGIALAPLFRMRGPKEEWLRVSDAALDAAERSGSRELVARARVVRTEALLVTGDLERADAEARAALDAARRAGARAVAAVAVVLRSHRAWLVGDVATYRALSDEALDLATQAGDRDVLGWTLAYRIGSLLQERRDGDARAAVDRTLGIAAEVGDDMLECTALGYAGILALYEARHDDARHALERAVVLVRAAGFRRREGEVLSYLAATLRELGDVAGARRAYDESIAAQEESGFAALALATRLDLVALEWEHGKPEIAEAAARNIVAEIASRGASARVHGLAHAYVGALASRRGEDDEVGRHLAAAHRLSSGRDDVTIRQGIALLEGVAEVSRARLALERGDRPAALRDLRVARGRAVATGGVAIEEARSAERILGVVLRELAHVEDDAAPAGLRVGPSARWIEIGEQRADLARRGPPRRVLEALVERRLARPGTAVTAAELIAAGWPRQRILPEAASMRLYTAVRLLRKLGLEDVLVTRDDGYLLDPDVSMAIVEV